MNNITIDKINKLRGYGLHLIPIEKKKPKTKRIGKNGTAEYSWKFADPEHEKFLEFSDDELLKYDLGVNHEASRTVAVDFDCEEALFFKDLIPETLTVSSVYEGHEKVRQKIFKLATDVEEVHESFPKANSKHQQKDGTVVEKLAHTQSWIEGSNRYISTDIPPKTLDMQEYESLRATIRKVYALSMFTRLYPKKDSNRDEFRLTLAGVLNLETKWDLKEKKHFVKELCKAAGDKAVGKALEKIRRVEQNIKRNIQKGKEASYKIWGTQHMSEILGRLGQDGGMDFVDAIRDPSLEAPETNEEDDKVDYSKTIAFSDLDDFITTEFPQPSYIIEPLVSDQSIVEIVGASGVGKTMFGLAIAGAISTANGFLGMLSIGDPRPILYVEGELPASDIQIRVGGMFEKINRKCDPKMFYVSSLQQQLKINDKGFTPIQTEQGLIEIENAMLEIKKRTGKMPVVFIDNISCLASGLKENDAEAWSPIINKFVKWKNMGSTVFYFHHLNKGNDSSGSTMQHRTIDMVIRMRKPDNKQKIKEFDEKGVQAIVDFPKWRLHDNSKHAQEHMLICEDWKWEKLPVLTSDEIEIVKMNKEGLDVKEMSKQIDLAEKTIYKKLKKLKDKGVIKDGIDKKTSDRETKEVC